MTRGGGPGGFDVNALMKQAQQMQEQMLQAQEKLKDETVEATVVRDIDRTETTVRVTLRVEGHEDFVEEWRIGDDGLIAEDTVIYYNRKPAHHEAKLPRASGAKRYTDDLTQALGLRVETLQPVEKKATRSLR